MTELISPVLATCFIEIPIPSVLSERGVLEWKHINSSLSIYNGSLILQKDAISFSLLLNGGYGSIGPL